MDDEPEPEIQPEEPIPWWDTNWFKEWEKLIERHGKQNS